MIGIIIYVFLLLVLLVGIFSSRGNSPLSDYELYGDIDPIIYGNCMASKEYERGYSSAIEMIKQKKFNPLTLLNEAKNDLTVDDFNKGWKDGCREHL